MKAALNLVLLILLVFCLGTAVTLFGGILPEDALPFYAVTGALVAVWGLKWGICRRVSGLWSPLHVPILIFLIYTLIRYFTSPIEHDSRVDLLNIGIYATVYFLVSQNLHRPRDRMVVLCALVAFAVAESCYGLWQFKTGSDHVLWLDRGTDYHGRGSGTYYCPNHLAGFLEMSLGLVAGWLVVYDNRDVPLQTLVLQRLFAVAAFAFLVLGLYSTSSRGGWIAATATIPVMLVLAEATRAVSSRKVVMAFVVFVCAAGGLWSVHSVRQRVGEAVDIDLGYRLGEQPIDVKSGLGGRTAMWRATFDLIRDYPIFGTGPGTWQWMQLKYRRPESQIRPKYTHNDVLQLVAEYGVTGFLLILAVLACFYWQALQLARAAAEPEQRAFAIGALAAVTAILIHSFVDFNFHIPANALVVAVLMGLIAAQERGGKSPQRERVRRLMKTIVGVLVIALAVTIVWVGGAMALCSRATARGFDFAQQHEWDDALREYRSALGDDSRAPQVYALIGDIYRMQSAATTEDDLQPERQLIAHRAMDAYQRALELNPYQSEIMLKMAAACELDGDPVLAFRWYEQALQVDPNNAFNWIRLGTFYRRQGDVAQAINALERARTLNPNDPTASDMLKEIHTGQP